MKLKKVLAGVLAGLLTVGCIPGLAGEKMDEVEAMVLPAESTEWVTDADGNSCKLLVKYTGWTGAYDNSVPTETKGYMAESQKNVFDGNEDTQVTVRGNSSGYANDGVQVGDYIGVQYKDPIQLKSFRLVYDELFKTDGDDAVLEYSTDAELSEESWVTLEDNITTPNGTKAEILKELDEPISNVYGVRLKSKNCDRVWFNVREIEVTNASVLEIAEEDLVAGSYQPDHESKEGPVKYLIDSNQETYWHSVWTEREYQKFWIDVDVTDENGNAQIVDEIRTLSRGAGAGNGRIYKYEVWVNENAANESDFSSGSASGTELEMYPWQANYTKVCEGTWKDDGEWKTAKFEAVEAKHIRLVAKETYTGTTLKTEPEYASLAEIRVLSSESETTFTDFRGMSLRKTTSDNVDYSNYLKTSIRFGYKLYELEDYELTGWKWNWGLSESSLTKVVEGTNKLPVSGEEGVYTSNLVIQNVPSDYYDDTIYSRLSVTYTNAAEEQLTVYTGVESRNVLDVANAALSNPEDAAYAQALIDAVTVN